MHREMVGGSNMKQQPDVRVRNEGSLFLFLPLTEQASAWIEDNVSKDATYFGDALVVEHRYARGLAQGMLDDGLVVV
jgi:hypothetical protein